MKIAFYTLGCKVNQYETQALEQLAGALRGGGGRLCYQHLHRHGGER